MSGKKENELMANINSALSEVQEILAKSGYGDMDKAEGEPDGDEGLPPPEGAEGAPEGAEGLEGAPEGAEGAEAAPEGAEGEQDPAQALAEQAQNLSDDELDHMIEALMTEKEARHGGEGEGAPAPEGADQMGAPAAPAPSGLEAQKSMKSEFAGLAKSMTSLADALSKIGKEVADLKAAKATTSKITARPAVSSKQQVLEKSAPIKQRLSKSDTLSFLEGEMRKRNPIVNSTLVAEVNLTKTEGDLAQIQDRLSIEGLNFPTR